MMKLIHLTPCGYNRSKSLGTESQKWDGWKGRIELGCCAQVELLLGDPAKARTKLGWNPQKTSLQQLVEEMVDADIEMARDPSAYLKY